MREREKREEIKKQLVNRLKQYEQQQQKKTNRRRIFDVLFDIDEI